MALILCPDCNTEVSDVAERCPKCGRPIAKKEINKKVKMKIPVIKSTWLGVALDVEVVVDGEVIWRGKSGNVATFEITKPTNVTVRTKDNKGLINPVSGLIEPGCKYNIVQDLGIHWKATYIITEVDMIDSE